MSTTTDLYSDTSGSTPTSPRISFSYDLSQSDTVPIEQLLRSDSSSSLDFNFCVQENSDLNHASTADELFSDGIILPSPLKLKPDTCNYKTTPYPAPIDYENENPQSMKQQNSKSIWGFKRSSSCGNVNGRSLCPITRLYRSNSTGSSVNSKQSSSCSKEGFNKKCNRNMQKPPLRKTGNYGYGNHTNAVRVDPVLNLGFGSFFSGNGKNKSKR